MQPLKIREANAEDIPMLIEIIREIFGEFGFIFNANDELPDFIGFAYYYRNSDRSLFVLHDDNQPAGCGALQIIGNMGLITRVYLNKDFRGRGYGKVMVRHLAEVARKAGATRVSLWSDTRFTIAHGMYESLGFKRFEKVRPLNDVNDSYEVYYEMKFNNEVS